MLIWTGVSHLRMSDMLGVLCSAAVVLGDCVFFFSAAHAGTSMVILLSETVLSSLVRFLLEL